MIQTCWPTVAEADKYSADFIVNNYLAAGLKPSQMNLGIGFYGRIPKRAVEPGIDWSQPDAQKNPATRPYFAAQQIELFESLGVALTKDTYVKYNDIVAKLINDPQKRFTQHWDDEAKVPWLSVQSADGQFPLCAFSYENPRSVAIKADYIKSKGLAGAMFWEYGADDQEPVGETAGRVIGDQTLNCAVSARTIGCDNRIRCASSGAAFHLQQKAWVLWLISRKLRPSGSRLSRKSAEALPLGLRTLLA